jgi:alpha-L-fucosidase
MRLLRSLALLVLAASSLPADNKPERLEWFRDQGFGLFIHWSFDVSLGSDISHTLVGASPDYVKRFYETLPGQFNPKKFDPEEWARLAKLAGMKYVVFTAKHHSGFCMFNTKTTSLNVMNTPYGADITARIIDAFRKQGLAVGLYISPDDFHWFSRNGLPIARPPAPRTTTKELPALMEYGKSQVRELLTNYGKIDMFFIDGPADGLREQAWETQPDIVVTRGAMETPEQHIPGIPMDQAWEACLTMGTQWPHKPLDERKSPAELIHTLIEIRAKGGNLLLNIGPRPDGALDLEEEARLRVLALWNFVNQESIEGVRPWVITNEQDIWFTKKKNEPTVYAFLTHAQSKFGDQKTVTLRSVRSTARTRVDVLGQSGEILEYRPDIVPKTTWKQDAEGLHISFTQAQRLYTDRRWPYPVVLKITNSEPALSPPQVAVTGSRWDAAANIWVLEGRLDRLGDAPGVEVGFQYRPRNGLTDMYEKTEPWRDLPLQRQTRAGSFSARLPNIRRDQDYEFRALVKHPLLTMYSAEQPLDPAKAVRLH